MSSAERLVQRLQERSWTIATRKSTDGRPGVLDDRFGAGVLGRLPRGRRHLAPEVRPEVLNVPRETLEAGIADRGGRVPSPRARSRLGGHRGDRDDGRCRARRPRRDAGRNRLHRGEHPVEGTARTLRATGDRLQVRHAVTQAAMEAALNFYIEDGE